MASSINKSSSMTFLRNETAFRLLPLISLVAIVSLVLFLGPDLVKYRYGDRQNYHEEMRSAMLNLTNSMKETIVKEISNDGRKGGERNAFADKRHAEMKHLIENVMERLAEKLEKVNSAGRVETGGVDGSNKLPPVVIASKDMDWCGPLMSGNAKNDYMRRQIPFNTQGEHKRIEYGNAKCVDGHTRWISQFHQDRVLWTYHFQFLSRRGIYLDVAANDPFRLSNTYFFDKCLGWKGICVEANENYFKTLKEYRGCRLVPTCVSDKKERVQFRLDGGLGGIEETNKEVTRKGKGETTQLECKTLKSVFDEEKVTVVDYLSLDVEGHELNVLKGIDWSKIKINIMTVETKPNTPVAEFITNMGYKAFAPPHAEEEYHWFNRYEMIYYAPGVIMGAPV